MEAFEATTPHRGFEGVRMDDSMLVVLESM